MTNGSSDSSKRGNRAGMRDLGRALGFLRQHRRIAAIAIVSLLLSIGAQLMVPQAVQNSLDAITDGLVLQQAGDLSPAEQQALAEAQGIDAGKRGGPCRRDPAGLHRVARPDRRVCHRARRRLHLPRRSWRKA